MYGRLPDVQGIAGVAPDAVHQIPTGACEMMVDKERLVARSGYVGAVGEEVGGALAEAVPFVGELAGLGMLIHGIVKAHRHEENSGGPKLSGANQEATEQTGGLSSSMLKGASGAPGIV